MGFSFFWPKNYLQEIETKNNIGPFPTFWTYTHTSSRVWRLISAPSCCHSHLQLPSRMWTSF
jgi:hypothetical protein